MTTLIACSHGTADPAGQAAIRAVIDDVRSLLPGVRVVGTVVDVEEPRIPEVLERESSADDAIVVPLLLSVGYHTAVDIAHAVKAHTGARQTLPLGTHPLIVDVLVDRLRSALPDGWQDGDHVVLAAAGSTDPAAEQDVEQVATSLRGILPVPVSVGYASASVPRVRDAVSAARAAGAQRVVVASHVLAPGFFARLVAGAGGDVVSAPLAPDARIAAVVVERFRDAHAPR